MYTYRVKVRRRTYLWGGEGIKNAFNPKTPTYLHFRVDEIGEPIKFGTQSEFSGTLTELGTLKPGESFTVPLKDIVGVYASLDDPQDTYIDCTLIISSAVSNE